MKEIPLNRVRLRFAVSQLLEDGGYAGMRLLEDGQLQNNLVPLYPPEYAQVQVGDIVEYGYLADSVIHTSLE